MSNQPLGPLLRVVRLPNLLVVAVTQVLVYYQVIRPALDAADIKAALTPWKFTELCLVTLLITASGYLINDVQDERIDAINRPGTNPIAALGLDYVSWLYFGVLFAGFLVSQLLAYRLQERALLWIFPVTIGLLSVYSVGMKRLPILGNLLVAFFCAGVPGIFLLAERRGVAELLVVRPSSGLSVLVVCGLFMFFALFATLLRELVKDLEDEEGDRAAGRGTIPVAWGRRASHALAYVLGGVLLVGLAAPLALSAYVNHTPLVMVSLAVLAIYLLVVLIQLARAGDARAYHRISTQLKFYMLGGLVLLAVL